MFLTDEVIGVFVSTVKTPEKFWIHVIGPGITALDKLVSEMTEYYNKAENHELHLIKTVKTWKIIWKHKKIQTLDTHYIYVIYTLYIRYYIVTSLNIYF